MSRKPLNPEDENRGTVAGAWNRRLKRIRDRRRAHQVVAGPRIPGENRLKVSLHEVWRILWGTHESGPK
jgi:hypothetical protein